MHGDHDQTVPLSQSQLFARKLREARVPVALYVVSNASHGFDPSGTGPVEPDQDTQLDISGDFLSSALR